MELLRPILELGVVIPGMLLAYFPAKSSLKQPLSKLVLWLVPLLALLCAAGGVVCYARRMPTAPMLAGLTLLAVVIYIKTLRISLWKSGTIALSVCAVFACINSLSRAINAAMLAGLPQAQAAPWFCLRSAICYHAICWLFAAIAYYPATHSVRRMVEDENFAQTWYVFWVLPLVFIALNLFMIPKYADTLYTGRVLQGYFVISITLLFLMLFFNAIFLLMAISINRNVRLQQENQLLSMQQQRYESLKAAIEEARQARHDLRHQLCQLAALAEEGNLEKIKAYLSGLSVLQAKRRRRRTSVRPSHRRKIRRGEYGYLSGRRILCKGHALWVIMPCLSKTARPQISAVSLPAIPVCTGSPFLQRR